MFVFSTSYGEDEAYAVSNNTLEKLKERITATVR